MSFKSLTFLTVLLLGFPASALAFKGRVVDNQGRAVANATVSILGRPGEAITDAEGNFEWRPDPLPPFEILVIQAGGTYMKPVLIHALEADKELVVTVEGLVSESVTVSGSAPSIESTPGSATTTISGTDVAVRQPSNLMQAIENVAGVNQVSEGQAAVPAIRGLARGRTLILVDGARVSSERRAGASAAYLDPTMVEGVDVARGPGSVAYGSDAFGGVISVRTRRVTPGSPWGFRFNGDLGAGVPERRGSIEISKGLREGGVLIAAHTRKADDWKSPTGDVFNSGYRDHGVMLRAEHALGSGELSVAWQSDFGRDIERPRNNSRTVRFFYPTEDSHRLTTGYEMRNVGPLQRVGFTGFVGSYAQVTDQDRLATATTGRSIERADVSAKDFQVRGFGERLFGRSRFEFGVDVNGRFGLHAVDDLVQFNLAGEVSSTRPNISIDTANRTDTGVYASIDTAVARQLVLGAGVRGDYVTTRNSGGFFGDRLTGNGDVAGFTSLTAGSFRGFTATFQVARGFRDPVLSDRYHRGPTGRGFITGNPDLEPETSLQFDVALRYAAPRFRVGTFYYHYRIADLIERYATATDFFFFRNRGRARVRGFEVEAQATIDANTTLEIATQVGEGRALDDHTYLDDISPINLTAIVRRQFTDRVFAQLRAAYFSDDDHFGPTERAVPGYTLLDLAGGVRVAKPLELRVTARNLLNQEYFASQDVRTVFAPGRSAAVQASVKF